MRAPWATQNGVRRRKSTIVILTKNCCSPHLRGGMSTRLKRRKGNFEKMPNDSDASSGSSSSDSPIHLKRESDDSCPSDRDIKSGAMYGAGVGDVNTPSKRPKFERSFVHSWLTKYSWLRYDASKNTMYCELCLKFKKSNAFTEGCQNFRRDNLNKHVNTNDHRTAAEQHSLNATPPTYNYSYKPDTSPESTTQLTPVFPNMTLVSPLGDLNGDLKKDDLPITPNYISNPPFPYVSPSSGKHMREPSPINLTISPGNHRQLTPSPDPNSQGIPISEPELHVEDELVLKVRVANVAETDFIEIEICRTQLTFENLLTVMCKELGVKKSVVLKVRKLPDTIVRKDKDVKRLIDFQELELVLTTVPAQPGIRNYVTVANTELSPSSNGLKPVDVVY